MSARPLVLLCAIGFFGTFSIGAFPVLLAEIGRARELTDFELGAIVAAFGLARLLADIPVGLYVTHHLRRAIVLAPAIVGAGVLCISIGEPFAMLVLGRALIGAGHALGTVSSLTTILKYREEHRLSFLLGAFEMSGMIGVLGGMALVGALPKTWPWNAAFLVACMPQAIAFFVLPRLLAAVPLDARSAAAETVSRAARGSEQDAMTRSHPLPVVLAFGAAAAIALAWAAVGQFILPLRADREFGLGRSGVALLLALPQFVDIALLLPLANFADRSGRSTVLGIVLISLAAGVALVAFAPLGLAVVGCVLLGGGLAGWVLPLGLLKAGTPSQKLASRTAQYRIAIDSGMFIGPLASGLLSARDLWLLSASSAVSLACLGVAMLLYHPRRTIGDDERP